MDTAVTESLLKARAAALRLQALFRGRQVRWLWPRLIIPLQASARRWLAQRHAWRQLSRIILLQYRFRQLLRSRGPSSWLAVRARVRLGPLGLTARAELFDSMPGIRAAQSALENISLCSIHESLFPPQDRKVDEDALAARNVWIRLGVRLASRALHTARNKLAKRWSLAVSSAAWRAHRRGHSTSSRSKDRPTRLLRRAQTLLNRRQRARTDGPIIFDDAPASPPKPFVPPPDPAMLAWVRHRQRLRHRELPDGPRLRRRLLKVENEVVGGAAISQALIAAQVSLVFFLQ